MIRFLLTFFLLTLFVSRSLFAQDQQTIDSLVQLTQKGDRLTRIDAYNLLSWELAVIDPQLALYYSEEALKLCLPAEKKLIATSLNRKGGAYDYMGDYETARKYYSEAGELRKQLKDTIGYSGTLLNVGATYYYQGLFNKALEYYILSAHLKEKVKDIDGLSKLYNNIGLIYRVQKKPNIAIAYLRKSLTYKKQLNNTQGIINSYSNIGIIYLSQNLCDSAIYYAEEAYRLSVNINSTYDIASSLSNLGFAFLCSRDYAQADYFFYETLQKLNKTSDNQTLAFCYKGMGESYYYQKKYTLALEYLKAAYQVAQKVNRKELLSEICLLQSKAYEKTGNYNEGLQAYKNYISYRDTVFSEENNRQLNELTVSYETELKEQDIRELSHQNELRKEQAERNKLQRNIAIIIILAIIVILALTYISLRNNKRLNTELDAKNKLISANLKEKEVLLKEIHHRVKNNLQIINGLLELQESLHQNTEIKNIVTEAQGRIKTMALIHEMLYQTDTISNIRFTDYAEKLIKGIHTGFSKKNWETEHQIEPSDMIFSIDTIIPLGLILNELVSNAYKYAFSASRINTIKISITKTDADTYQLKFNDNGPGIKDENILVQSDSFGLKLVKMLCRQLKGKVEYTYCDGAMFIITFKEIIK